MNDVRHQELQAIFGPAIREARDGQETLVQCPHCLKRGMKKPDTSGHLGLNFNVNKAHCVRCGWSHPNLRKYLREVGYNIAGGTLRELGTSLRQQLKGRLTKPEPQYLDQQLEDDANWVPIAKAPSEYLQSMLDKGLTKDICKRWDIRACIEGPQEGYVIFRFTEFGGLVYWQGRAAWSRLLRKYSPPLPMGASNWVYNYPEDNSDVFDRVIILTEGTLDCISVMEVVRGTELEDQIWAVSLQGTSMSEPTENRHWLNSQLGKIRSMKPRHVLVMLDPEERKKADRLVLKLQAEGFRASRATYLHGRDPNELFRTEPEYLLEILRNRIQVAA